MIKCTRLGSLIASRSEVSKQPRQKAFAWCSERMCSIDGEEWYVHGIAGKVYKCAYKDGHCKVCGYAVFWSSRWYKP